MDKDFICKMMNFDWRIRPTVKELLKDDWWDVEEEQVCVTGDRQKLRC
jgi:hypothetical protein